MEGKYPIINLTLLYIELLLQLSRNIILLETKSEI